jgi:hypothetical protein
MVRVAVSSCIALVAASAASLDFPVRRLTATPEAGAKTVEFSFPFANRGRRPVTIKEIHSSCSCAVAQGGKKTMAPGEEGAIPVTFTIGHAFGHQLKTVSVITDDHDEPLIRLVIEVELPEGPAIEPKVVRWNHLAEPLPQAIEVRIPAGSPWRITKIHDAQRHFTVTWEAARDGRYQLLVTPVQTAHPANGVISMETDSGVVFQAFAQVLLEPPSPAPDGP